MAFGLAESLQRLGVAQALAVELQKQIEARAGDVKRLLAVGAPVAQAKVIATGITADSLSATKLVASGMPAILAKFLSGAVVPPPPPEE